MRAVTAFTRRDDVLELTLQIIAVAGCADLAYAIYEKRKNNNDKMEEEDL